MSTKPRRLALLPALVFVLLHATWAFAAAGDPVIATDPTTGGVITQSKLERMVEADRRAASLFNMPPPGPAVPAEMSEALKSGLMRYDAGLRALLTQADRNLPYALPWLANATPESRQRFIDLMRPKIMGGRNEGFRYVNLAVVLSGAGERGIKAGLASGGNAAAINGLLASQNRMQNALMGAIRSGTPSCNVWTGAATQGTNPGYCHP